MCGIFGYIGKNQAQDIIIDGLKKLEYRGYDSCGCAISHNNKVLVHKVVGNIDVLEKKVKESPLEGTIGVGHTRWSTSGHVNLINAHPHCYKEITVVHNGIIENFDELQRQHHTNFTCDSAIIPYLIDYYTTNYYNDSIKKMLSIIKGNNSMLIMINKVDKSSVSGIYAIQNGCPLVIGKNRKGYFISSDDYALPTKHIKYLKAGEIFYFNNYKGYSIKQDKIIDINGFVERKKYCYTNKTKNIMLQEIYEQPQAVKDTIKGKIDNDIIVLSKLKKIKNDLINTNKIYLIGCGTSYHACLVGKYLFEQYISNISIEVDNSSEFRYRSPSIKENDIIIVLSQSGETADTLAVIKEYKQKATTVLITNTPNSSIDREVDVSLYTKAGKEIAVASTKAYTSQLVMLYLVGGYLSCLRNYKLWKSVSKDYIEELKRLPETIEKTLSGLDFKKISDFIKKQKINHYLFIGRQFNYPTALEGALKLKEIAYIPSEGYPAGEMKHGPLALIDSNMMNICINPQSRIYNKTLLNIDEILARNGKIIHISTQTLKNGNFNIIIPKTLDCFYPILTILPLQIIACVNALIKGTNIDKPRNLAKSVTVE